MPRTNWQIWTKKIMPTMLYANFGEGDPILVGVDLRSLGLIVDVSWKWALGGPEDLKSC